MRTVLTCLACLCLMAPATLLAAPTGPEFLSVDDDGRIAAKGKKKKKKKGKKNAEPETPPPPPPDADGDGLPDEGDKCVDEAEDKDGFEDEDGCPDPDNDGDGILDGDDLCPDDPELMNGIKDEDGCPDEMKTVITKEKIVILDKVLFDLDKATIKKESDDILTAVAKVLIENPQITKIRVEGHTDATGSADHNASLSNNRATAVMKWLIKNGVDASRLESKGYGSTQLLVQGDDDAAHAKNRRVEFIITEQDDLDLTGDLGCTTGPRFQADRARSDVVGFPLLHRAVHHLIEPQVHLVLLEVSVCIRA